MQRYLCPVCGYPDLDEPAYDQTGGSSSFDICPCCGHEFGYDDPKTPEEKENFLRDWIKSGMPWFRSNTKPFDWDVKLQLKRIGVDFDELMK